MNKKEACFVNVCISLYNGSKDVKTLLGVLLVLAEDITEEGLRTFVREICTKCPAPEKVHEEALEEYCVKIFRESGENGGAICKD